MCACFCSGADFLEEVFLQEVFPGTPSQLCFLLPIVGRAYLIKMPPKKQRVIVSYSGSDTIKVPKGIDLEAPGVEYYVKWARST